MCSRQQRSPERLCAASRFAGATGLFLPAPFAESPSDGRLFSSVHPGERADARPGCDDPADPRAPLAGAPATRRSPVASRTRSPPPGGSQGLAGAPTTVATIPPSGDDLARRTRFDSPDLDAACAEHADPQPSWLRRSFGIGVVFGRRDRRPRSNRARTTTCRRRGQPLSQRPDAARDGRPTRTHAPRRDGALVLATRRRHTRRTPAGSRASARLPALFMFATTARNAVCRVTRRSAEHLCWLRPARDISPLSTGLSEICVNLRTAWQQGRVSS